MKGIRKILIDLRCSLPRPELPIGYRLNDYKFKDSYKDNHFWRSGQTCNDMKCHILAGKWEVVELKI